MAHTIRNAGVILPLLLLAPALEAQIYRWVDDAGVTHFSSSPPPESAERERTVLDRSGRPREVLPAPPTAEDREQEARRQELERLEAEQRAQEEAKRQAEAAALQQRVRQLHQSYANIEDILEERDRRLAVVENNLMLSARQMETLQRERDRIADQIDRHTGNAQTLERYQRELADLDRRLEREKVHQDRQRRMAAEIEAAAQRDIDDYQRLLVSPPDTR
jgi:chromosome segregation ATPase